MGLVIYNGVKKEIDPAPRAGEAIVKLREMFGITDAIGALGLWDHEGRQLPDEEPVGLRTLLLRPEVMK